jgi:limonene-1,2-epoxide hydrolase
MARKLVLEARSQTKANHTRGYKMDTPTPETKEVVLGFGKALNDGNYEAARRYVSDNMSYVGPFGSRDGAEAYLHEMKRVHLKFHVLKIFADKKDVCVLYDISVSGITLFACGWFQVEAGKVRSMRVTFDPRPLLAKTDPVSATIAQ